MVEAKGSGGVTVYAAVNPDKEARLASSSGGIFTLLAESVLAENGVVFGARFDKDWNVIHDYTETKEGLKHFGKQIRTKPDRRNFQAGGTVSERGS